MKAMTVLNAYQIECNDNDLVYLKSEVDTILTDKDKEIVKLKKQIALLQAELTQNQEYHNG